MHQWLDVCCRRLSLWRRDVHRQLNLLRHHVRGYADQRCELRHVRDGLSDGTRMHRGLVRGGVHRELPCGNHLQRRAMFVWHWPKRTCLQRLGDLLQRDVHPHRYGCELRRVWTHLRGFGRVL